MKVVVAIDSLKGSLTSMQAGNAIKDGVLLARPDADVVIKPLADGGEGTTDALIEGLGAEKVSVTVTGPLGKPVTCYYGIIKDTNTAILEMASSGIVLLKDSERDPLQATTYGVGEMILNAIENGCCNFIIGIGGSATNDGGIGMLKALGFVFQDKKGHDVGEGAQALGKIQTISYKNVNPILFTCQFRIACDVKNPLCGENGATYIFGPQKGVTEQNKEKIDKDMAHYADVTASVMNNHYMNAEGAGAAGGLGFAFLSFLQAELTPGISLFLNAINLEEELKSADIVITGEGRLDNQTAMGKAPIGVAKLAKKYNLKVLAFAGSVAKEATACNEAGIDAFFPILRSICTLDEAMDSTNAYANMRDSVEQVFRLL